MLADSLSAVDQLAPAPAALAADTTAAAPSLHSVAIYLFGFTGGPSYTALPPNASTAAAAESLAFGTQPSSLNSYYLEQTYGQLGFTGKVFGPFNIVDSSQTCNSADLQRWESAAEAAAQVDDTFYQHHVFVFPQRPSCPFAGIAEIGGHHVWINGDYSVRVLAHELGHNLGLAHAGGLVCTDAGVPAPMGDSCTADGFEYLDPFDAMGSGDIGSGQSLVRQMSMEHKLALHLLPTSAVKVIGTSGTYRVAPMETLTGTPELLRIPKFGGGNYFVEYRQPIGFFDSQGPPFANGVLIRTESPEIASNPAHPNADTALIDMHPETAEDWNGRGDGPGPGVHRSPARHHDPERRPGRLRRHARDHGARRHAAAERAERPFGGRQRHDGAAALERGDRRLLGRRLRRQARRSPGRHARHDGLHRHGPRPGHDGLLHRGGRRRRRQHRPGRHRQPCDTRHRLRPARRPR